MTSGAPRNATPDLIQALQQDVSALVRQEVRQAKDELSDKAEQAGRGALLLGGAAVLGMLAVGGSTAYTLRLLDRFLPPATAAGVLTGLYGVGAGVLAAAGIAELRRTLPLVPENTVADLSAEARAAAQQGGATG